MLHCMGDILENPSKLINLTPFDGTTPTRHERMFLVNMLVNQLIPSSAITFVVSDELWFHLPIVIVG